MALQTDFELDGVIHHNCYLRIHKIRTQVSEYEHFDNVVDQNGSESQRLVWTSRKESVATACVWVDELARVNRALPMKTFTFEFEYDLSDTNNIYQQAYKSLKSTSEFAEAVDV